MTEEKLWVCWEKYKSTLSITTTPEGDDFLATGQGPERVLAKAGTLVYGSYPEELAGELDGPNAALAGRMIRIFAQVRTQGMIPQYCWEKDTDICCRAGFTFDEILKGGYLRYPAAYSGRYTWELAEILLRHYPAEAEAYADQLLRPAHNLPWNRQKSLDALMKNCKKDPGVYLMAAMACQMLLLDGERYARYLPAVETVAETLCDDHIAVLLYHGRCLSKALLKRFKDLILENTEFIRDLEIYCLERPEFLTLLQELELPVYPYYILELIAFESADCQKKARQCRDLYREDHAAFLETYRRLAAMPRYDYAVYSVGLLAIMLQNGEGGQDLEQSNTRILSYVNMLNSFFGEKVSLTRDFLMPDRPIEELAELLPVPMTNLVFSMGGVILGLYASLYTYAPVAKKLFDVLLASSARHQDADATATVIGCFLAGREAWLGIPPVESAELLIAGGLPRERCYTAYCKHATDGYSMCIGITAKTTAALVAGHEEEAIAYLRSGDAAAAGTAAFIDLLYSECGFTDCGLLVDLLKEKSKLVRKKCEELLTDHEEEARPLLEERLPKLKGDSAQSARRLLKLWDNERKFGKDFNFADNGMMVQFCEDNYNADNKKTISWIPEDMLLDIRYADLSAKAPAIVAKFLLVEYMSLSNPYRVKSCDKVVERLHPQDLQASLENIYRLWLEGGADTKKKAILIPYCVYASDPQVIRLRRQIEQWADSARGALGAYAVNAVALNGGSVALMMVDSMAAKFPNSQVKNAARSAFAYAAKALEIPEDELSDRIVPDLGFGRDGEKTLDYGPRTFTVSLLPDFSLSIQDNEKGKTVKSLPKPGPKDDPVKAEAAKKEFSELKKQMKAVVQTQSARLERVLMDGRRWTVDRWNALFVENAIMHRFATGLVWGVYEGDRLQTAFRYMDDGTFNTADEEEFQLPANAQITLVHPVDLDGETLEAWTQQLEDYEVTQPIEQLSKPALLPAEQEYDGKAITRYKGRTVSAGKLSGAAKKYSMVRGEVLDGGSYICFHLVDKYLNLAAQINFEFMYMGMEFSETVPLEKLLFYRLPEDGFVRDEPEDNLILDPKNVPARFVSSVITILDAML